MSKASNCPLSIPSNTWEYSSPPILSGLNTSPIYILRPSISLACCIGSSTRMLIWTRYYISFIRPHLEYCSAVWDPYLAKNMELLEKNTEIWTKNWSSDYNALLSQANIPALTTTCSEARLSHLFK